MAMLRPSLVFLACSLPISACAGGGSAPKPTAATAQPVASGAAPTDGRALAPKDPEPPAGLRLATTVRPTAERLELTLDPNEERFAGVATIDVTVAEATPAVWLHAVDLEVTRAEVRRGGVATIARVVSGTFGRIGIVPPEPLAAGAATLVLTYRGVVDSTRSRGIYREREGGANYAYTFFEATDARRAFPCFDEPGFKIPWTLTFHLKAGDVAAANTEVRDEGADAAGLKLVRFAPSKPLPSYLVAFLVGPFDAVTTKDGPNGRPIRIYVPKGRGNEATYAQSITADLVRILEKQIGVPYPYEKLDVAVVPRFWGTMEHPGIVALGQPLTLIAKGEETVARKKRYANIAIHELAHYWFGDLVTTAWWDDAWLNESFGTWADGKATETFAPEWEMRSERLRTRQAAIAADSLATAKPVRAKVVSEGDIQASFDNTSTYFKGAAVLDMLEQWAGAPRFRDAIAKYLRAHANGVATMDDMVAALRADLGADAADALSAFIERPGVPVVSFELACAKGAAPRLHLTQERFRVEGATPDASPPWPIPICFRYGTASDAHRACTVLRERAADVPLEGASCPKWLVGQENGVGYFVASYDRALAEAALSKASRATPVERLAIVYDASALANAGVKPTSDALALVRPLQDVGTPHALRLALATVTSLEFVAHDEDRAPLAAYVRRAFGPLGARLGFKAPADPVLAMLQPEILAGLLETGKTPALIAQAKRLADAWLKTRGTAERPVDDALLGTVLATALANGDKALYARYREVALSTATPREDQRRVFTALGDAPTPALLDDALGLLLDPKVDLREASGIAYEALDSYANRERAFEFLLAHLGEMTARMRDDDASHMLTVAWAFCDEEHAARAEKSLASLASRIDGGRLELSKSVARARACAKTREERASALHAFLTKPPTSK